MNPINDILNSVRSKLKPRTIIILGMICVLIFPAILIENAAIPTGDSGLFLLSSANRGGNTAVIQNANSSGSQTYYLLNHKLNAANNVSVILNISVADRNLLTNTLTFEYIYFKQVTSAYGNFTLNNTILEKQLPSSQRNKENAILNYYIDNYSVLNSRHLLIPNQKDETFSFNAYPIVNREKKSIVGYISFAFLPSYQLGYYGLAPVILSSGASNGKYNLSYHTYNPQNNNSVGPRTCIGNFSFNKIYSLNTDEQMLLTMNEAQNVTFIVNGTPIGTAFRSNVESSFTFTSISILGLLGSSGSEIMLLVVVFMVLLLFVPMFNPSVYKYYLSLPRKRWYIIANEFYSSIITMSIFESFAFLASYVVASAVLHLSISSLAFVYIYLLSIAAFTVFASLYLLVGVYFIGRTTPRTLLTVFLVIGYPIIASISQAFFELISFTQFFSNSDLFKPILQNIRTYNVISGIAPVLNVEELNSYFLRSPVTGVVMLNHLSIFDLSPFIFVSSIVGISLATFYISIKRYYRY